jgi:hypothetical protein
MNYSLQHAVPPATLHATPLDALPKRWEFSTTGSSLDIVLQNMALSY